MMKIRQFLFLVLLILPAINGDSCPLPPFPYTDFDVAAYYKILKTGRIAAIDTELTEIEVLPSARKGAYKGALLMKKAGLLQKPKDKLEQFKKGRIELERVILADSSNTEYRFLRLIIQEHAPKITKYHDQLGSDSAYIRQHFNQLPAAVQAVVRDYSKTSSTLKAADLE